MITKLTKKQKAQIPVYIEKWINKAGEPIDRNKTVKITKELFGDDKTVLIAESIQNALDIIQYISKGKELKFDSQLGSQLRSQLDSQLGSQPYSQLGSQLDSQLRSQLYSQLRSQLGSQLGSQLDSQLYSQLRSQLDSQLGSQLDSQLGSQLGSQLYSQLYSQLRSQLGDTIPCSHYTTLWWYSWFGYYDFAKDIGVQFDMKKFNRMEEIILNIPIIITLGQILIVVEKPTTKWSNARIHSDIAPAISWKDGTGLYFLNGVHFERELWERVTSFRESKDMPFDEILKISDVDQRTQAMKYGKIEDFIKHAKAKLLDTVTKYRFQHMEHLI
jgi:hypothetical protein